MIGPFFGIRGTKYLMYYTRPEKMDEVSVIQFVFPACF
jgi:hypothetical protein